MKSKIAKPSRATSESAAVAQPSSRLTILLPWIVLLAAVLFAVVVRVRLLQIPLERDEGEYAYAGQLLLHGVPPYREAFNMKFPGVYAAYGVIMGIFGQTVAGIHLGLLMMNVVTIVLVFLMGMRLLGAIAGAAASAAYALLSVSETVYGTQAHATHFVVLPVLAACLLLLRPASERTGLILFSSGIFLGLGILMKQHGLFFALFGALWLLWDQRTQWRAALLRECPPFAAGVSLPLALTAIALYSSHVFAQFWFWTFTYAREYVLEMSLSEGIDRFKNAFPPVVGPNFLLWLFAAGGALLIWRKKDQRRAAAFLTGLLAFSFLAVCPGLFFRAHYFVLMLPALALLAGATVDALAGLIGYSVPCYLYAAVLLFCVFEQSDFLFRLTPLEACRRVYSLNPFPEAIPVAEYIRAHTPENARIAVLGSEPEIYFYANRRSVTGYIYTYGMMEHQPYAPKMQEDMIHDIEAARPKYVVLARASTSWGVRSDSLLRIFVWWDAYCTKHYRKAGVADVLPGGQTEYRWDNVENYDPKTGVVLEVWERKD